MYRIALIISTLFIVFGLSIHTTATSLYDDIIITPITDREVNRQNIRAITQDTFGFIWIGTSNGLLRYDGSSFKIYRHEPRNPHSLPNSSIRALFLDDEGNLWITTQGGGLSLWNHSLHQFESYLPSDIPSEDAEVFDFWTIKPNNNGDLWLSCVGSNHVYLFKREIRSFQRLALSIEDRRNYNEVTVVLEDSKNRIWVGSNADGVGVFSLNGKKLISTIASNQAIPSDRVRSLIETKSGNVWVGTLQGGAAYFDEASERFIQPELLSNPEFDHVYLIKEDNFENLWIATDAGLLIYNPREHHIEKLFRHDSDDAETLLSNKVRALYNSIDGVIWLGTESGGLHRLTYRKGFNTIQFQPENTAGLTSNIVRTFLEIDENTLWIGTEGGGINVYDREKRRIIKVFERSHHETNTVSGNEITTFLKDSNDVVWIGTWGNGLDRYDLETGRFTNYRFGRNNPHSITDDRVQLLQIDSAGNFWVGTENGLHLFDPESEIFERVFDAHSAITLTGSSIQTLGFIENPDGTFWIGTWQGLNLYDPKNETVEHFYYDPSDPYSLSSDHITALYRDANYLWIATFGGGLNKKNLKSGDITIFTEMNGLASNTIFSIIPDDLGFIWLSTNNGLSRFEIESQTFVNFRVEDGLQANDFWWGAAKNLSDNQLIFGGTNGFTYFHPYDILPSEFNAPIVISSVKVFETRVNITPNEPLILNHRDNYLTIAFASLDFTAPSKNQYRHKLANIEDDWIFSGNRNMISYAALRHGHYTFRVQGTNSDGIWSTEEAFLEIIILPPYWATWWFRFFVAFFLGISVFGFIRFRTARIRKQNQLLEETVRERTRDLAQQKEQLKHSNAALLDLNQEKNYLISVVAHDLRNPLATIQSLAELISMTDDLKERDDFLERIHNISQKGLQLIAKILDAQNLDKKSLKRNTRSVDFVNATDNLVKRFDTMIQEKKMNLNFTKPDFEASVLADETYLTMVLDNLLSNAIKFSPKGSEIDISLIDEGAFVTWIIKDQGPGFSAEDLKKLFQRYQRLSATPTGKESSTGLGLSIVKLFTEAMDGTVTVESSEDAGATFKISLPRA